MKKNNKFTFPIIAGIVILIAVLIGFWAGNASVKQPQRADAPEKEATVPVEQQPEDQQDDADWESTVVFNGREYEKNRNLKTVLFMGVDDKPATGDLIGLGGRSDALILLIVDQSDKTARMLEISRDTMTDVDVYDNDGRLLYTANMQLCMQYAFGDSPRRSCYLTKERVSKLLYGLNIDYYCSMTMEGISAIVDGIGGITLTMPEDYTEIDPAYVTGAVIHMDGAETERFVRTRDLEHSGGNDARMERQNWFLLELVRQLKQNKVLSVSDLVDLAAPYMETDLDADMLALLHSCTLKDDSLKVPGKTCLGDVHDEYYVDNDALQEMLIQLFYLPKD